MADISSTSESQMEQGMDPVLTEAPAEEEEGSAGYGPPPIEDEEAADSEPEEMVGALESEQDDDGGGTDEEDDDDEIEEDATLMAEDPLDSESDAGEDSDTAEEENLEKLADLGRKDFLRAHHPQAIMHNSIEIKRASVIKRDSDGRIDDPIHRSPPFLSKYELTRVLGLRASQLDAGAAPFVGVPADVLDGYTIAEAELHAGKIPFVIRRPMPNGTSEYWRLQDLEMLRAPAGIGLRIAQKGTPVSTSTGSRS